MIVADQTVHRDSICGGDSEDEEETGIEMKRRGEVEVEVERARMQVCVVESESKMDAAAEKQIKDKASAPGAASDDYPVSTSLLLCCQQH